MSGVNSKLNSLIQYRYNPRGSNNSTPTKQSGVLGRRGIITIDSDDDESAAKSSQNSVQVTPKNTPVKRSDEIHSPNSHGSSSSLSSSPWLSKASAQLQSPNRKLPQHNSALSKGSGMSHTDFLAAMANLEATFPNGNREKMQEILRNTGSADRAKGIIRANLHSIGTPQKRPLSSPAQSPSSEPRTFKRIKTMSDSSNDGDESEFSEAVEKMYKAFPSYKKVVLENILGQYGQNLDAAMRALTNYNNFNQKKKESSVNYNMGSIKAFQMVRTVAKNTSIPTVELSGSDDDDDSQDSDVQIVKESSKIIVAKSSVPAPSKPVQNGIATVSAKSSTSGTKRQRGHDNDKLISLDENFKDSEDLSDMEDESDEELEDATSGKPILDFFNTVQIDELSTLNGCSKKKAELLVSLRPFENWNELAEKLHENKVFNLIGSCKSLLKIRRSVDQLLAICEGFSKKNEQIVNYLLRNTTLGEDESEDTYIRQQPSQLNNKLTLKPFQMVGLNWLVLMHKQEINGILADEMGLGKTIQTIAFLTHLLETGDKGPHLIVSPSSTLDNWLRELSIWSPDLKVLLYYGSQDERKELRNQIINNECEDYNVLVTTYNMASGGIEDRVLFKKTKFHYAVFDEGHMLKNMTSLRYQHLMKIRASRRLLLTGTPLQNNLVELMSLLAFIMPEIFYDKQAELKTIFTTVSNKSDDARSKYERSMIQRAKGILKPFYLRRLKSQVLKQLPQKQEKVEHIPMSTEQHEVYDELKQTFSKEFAEKTSGRARAGTAMLMELRKAANHHLLLRKKYEDKKLRKMAKLMLKEPTHCEANEQYIFEDMQVMNDFELHRLCCQYKSLSSYKLSDEEIIDSGKFRHLDELLPKHKEEGSRVLIFSQFTMVLDVMEVYMKFHKHKFLRLDGQTNVADRQELIDEFSASEEIFIFLLSTKAGGLGINLTAANVVIIHDIDFNPYNDKQAEDRCHRVGQTRDVMVYRLLSKGTIEEGMHRCSLNKLKLEQDVTGFIKDKNNDEIVGDDLASLLREALKST